MPPASCRTRQFLPDEITSNSPASCRVVYWFQSFAFGSFRARRIHNPVSVDALMNRQWEFWNSISVSNADIRPQKLLCEVRQASSLREPVWIRFLGFLGFLITLGLRIFEILWKHLLCSMKLCGSRFRILKTVETLLRIYESWIHLSSLWNANDRSVKIMTCICEIVSKQFTLLKTVETLLRFYESWIHSSSLWNANDRSVKIMTCIFLIVWKQFCRWSIREYSWMSKFTFEKIYEWNSKLVLYMQIASMKLCEKFCSYKFS